jgi:hypothetical protein
LSLGATAFLFGARYFSAVGTNTSPKAGGKVYYNHGECKLAGHSNEVHPAVSDSGRGFEIEIAKQGRGLGLTSMQEQVRLVNGTIPIASTDGWNDNPRSGATGVEASSPEGGCVVDRVIATTAYAHPQRIGKMSTSVREVCLV